MAGFLIGVFERKGAKGRKGIYSAKERVTPEEISNPSYEGNVSCHDKAEPGYLLEAS